MCNNDFYNDNDKFNITPTSTNSSKSTAKNFMKEVYKHPTHHSKKWICIDRRDGNRVYFNN